MRSPITGLLLLLTAACAAGPPAARLQADPWPRPPVSATLVRREIAAALERSDRHAVTLGMVNLARMGAALSPATQARLSPLLDPASAPPDWRTSPPLPERLATAFAANAADSASGARFSWAMTTIPAEHRLIEGIAGDRSGRLFAGSVVDRRLLVNETPRWRDGPGWREVPLAAPVGGVFGMAVDPARRLLWFASAAADPMPHPETAFSGLVAVDLDRLVEARRIPVPNARLGDVALASDGTVYASDGQSGAVYRCRPGCDEAELLVPPGILRSPQGMVVWPGDRLLYVADYELGLFRIDLRSLSLRPLVARAPQMLDGIDGLVRSGTELVAIQNGTRPLRLVTIFLDRGGRVVEDVSLIARNDPAWGEPTLGLIENDSLIYVADAQWERYGPGGLLTDGGAPRPTQIRLTRLPVRALSADELSLD